MEKLVEDKDRTFVPPRTNGDLFRSLPDEEIASALSYAVLAGIAKLISSFGLDPKEVITEELANESIRGILEELRKPADVGMVENNGQ